MERKKRLDLAIDKLGKEFNDLDLTFHKMTDGKKNDITSYWPGPDEDDILICVFKGTEIEEPFHRQDFFFLNYAYRQSYQALSISNNNLITINEDECYISQPYTGYALRCISEEDTVIIGVLIKRDAFFREYLPTLYADSQLFNFFIEPQKNKFSDAFIHLSVTRDNAVRTILEMMVIEYADRGEDTQNMLKFMLQTLFLQIARLYRLEKTRTEPITLSEKIIRYMEDHSDVVTLRDIATHFSYNPNYISALLHRETGRTFSEILLQKRMERAILLLRNTTLSIEEIAAMLGYSNNSNFYKAFREYYGTSPRKFE